MSMLPMGISSLHCIMLMFSHFCSPRHHHRSLARSLVASVAGLPASIVTDKFQGIIMGLLVILLTLAVTTNKENHVSRSQFSRASNWTTEGLQAAVTLILAICSAELFNQGNWQRVWAAESVPAMRKGLVIGSVMVFFLMMFFGIMGMLAYAKDPDSYDNFEKFAYLSFFDLLGPMKTGWHIMTLILVTALAASSVDTLQNALSSIFSRDLVKIGWNPKWIARAFMVIVNIPAVFLASKKFDVINLFLVADLVCATAVFPVFLGLQTNDKGILKAPTELGAFCGIISGFVTVLVNGVINGVKGDLFEYFWLRNGGICSLCGTKTMVSFIITPVVSLVMTYIFSFLDIMVRGERARRPLITVPFDDDDISDEVEDMSKNEEQEGEGNDDIEQNKIGESNSGEKEDDV
jgi:solute:Na+ symporter, SSS family